eukprot:TRINITY_DN37453_c0_g2_i1.p1 TRINITY_DN37453_c0_g2~~TRINITY_DN37453_c0_g2_i1.p1  ORF type:complete len:830 (+),score=186.52 TRINITY_DN37453_c0_g2_i1:183-2672(+)
MGSRVWVAAWLLAVSAQLQIGWGAGVADVSPLGYRLEGHRRRSGIAVPPERQTVTGPLDVGAAGDVQPARAAVEQHGAAKAGEGQRLKRSMVRRVPGSYKRGHVAAAQLEAEGSALFQAAEKDQLLERAAEEAAKAPRGGVERNSPQTAAAALKVKTAPAASSLAELTAGNEALKSETGGAGNSKAEAFSLAGAGAMGGLVQQLVRWLRGSATYEEIYATDLFRQWLSSHHGEATKASVLLHNTATPEDWSACADEGETCQCASGVLRYGHGDSRRFFYKNVTRLEVGSPRLSIHCGNEFFMRDPAPGTQKSCHCLALWKVVTCRDGGTVDWSRCPAGAKSAAHLIGPDGVISVPDLAAERLCSEGCNRQQILLSERQEAAHTMSLLQASVNANSSLGVAVSSEVQGRALCKGLEPNDLLWSCEMRSSGRFMPTEHAQAQAKMTEATARMCAEPQLAKQLEVYLDCDFVDNYKKWTKDGAQEWLDEAYVTYIGGPKDSTWEWQATNLVRSVELFSTRPIIVVAFTDFAPPASWRKNHNVLVYRMQPGLPRVSFNFNKIRSMLVSRVVTGIQLDTDQIVASGMDNVFESTRREIHSEYPYPMLPVHWMSRDAGSGEPYYEYHQVGYDGPRTMRWGQAHPTWSYHSLPFLADLLHERLTVADRGLKIWMLEDEDMLNVKSWQAGATKQWCKFDLFPDLFVRGPTLEHKIYHDNKWYPNGIGLVFYAAHATKEFTSTDWLVALLARCSDPEVKAATQCGAEMHRSCWGNWISEQKDRLLRPEKHTLEMCCCLRPRDQQAFFYDGQWYSDRNAVPDMTVVPGSNSSHSRCIFP